MITLDIQEGTEKHSHITRALRSRIDMSTQAMEERHKEWRRSEDDYLAYIPASEVEKSKEASRESSGDTNFRKIVVPYNYSMLMTAHTYMSSTLLSQNPVFSYTGAHGEPEMNSLAIQSLVAYQMREQGNLASLYLWLMDAGKFGLGILCDYWDEDMHYISTYEDEPVVVGGIPLGGRTRRVKRVKEIPGYEGSKLFNVSPYNYIPDPRVPLNFPERGEFAGRFFDLSYSDIVSGKLQERFIKKNADKILKMMEARTDSQVNDHSPRIVLPGDSVFLSGQDPSTGLSASIRCAELVVTIIPKLWNLGANEYPEKWVFLITYENETAGTLLSARPQGLYHNRFPYHILEYEMDAYSLFKRSMMDIARPLNETMSWLLNSHFYSVERSLNGEWIFDPSKVSAADVYDSRPGKRLRLRPSAYNTDVRTVFHSLQTDSSVTGTHMRDISAIAEILNRVMGINEGMMGDLPSSRTSATASRIATSASTSRLKTIVEYFAATGFQTLANNLCQNAQQLYTGNQKFRIAGDIPNDVENFLTVTPEILAGNFEYIPSDGSAPLDRVATMNMWVQMLGQFRQFPQLGQKYDIGKIVGWVMQQGGIKNLKQFEVTGMSPEVAAAEAAKGNLIPVGDEDGSGLGGYGGGNPSGGLGRSEEEVNRNSAQLPNPGQSGGLGRTN